MNTKTSHASALNGTEAHERGDHEAPADRTLNASRIISNGLKTASDELPKQSQPPTKPADDLSADDLEVSPFQEEDRSAGKQFSFLDVVPAFPYSCTKEGVFVQRGSKETPPVKILPHALHIEGRSEDLDSGTESVSLIWERDRQWKRKTVPQRIVASTREIVGLADSSLLVNSTNARDLVAFIAHLQAQNKDHIPLNRAVSSCGWKMVGGKWVFMWGATPICAEQSPAITFTAEVKEIAEIIAPFHAKGSLEGWKAIARQLKDYPLLAFGIAASFLSPFLDDLPLAQNPIVDFGGGSSSGKTTALKLVASVWGLSPETGNGLVRSWNGTPVFLERLGATCTGLPLFLDESHIAKPELLSEQVYGFANGSGRGRGAKDGGVQKTVKYRSVLFSAGEAKLTNTCVWDGAAARIVAFWGSPFGDGNQRDFVVSLTHEALLNYGQAGPYIVKECMEHRETYRAQMLSIHQTSLSRLVPHAADPIAERLANIFAAVEAVGVVVSRLLDLDWDMRAITDAAFAKAADNRSTSSKRQALEAIVSWADGNPHSFHPKDERPVEMAGFIRSDDAICFHPDKLRRLLTERKYTYDGTISHWADEKWIERDVKGNQNAKTVRRDNKSMRMIIITPAAVALARGEAVP